MYRSISSCFMPNAQSWIILEKKRKKSHAIAHITHFIILYRACRGAGEHKISPKAPNQAKLLDAERGQQHSTRCHEAFSTAEERNWMPALVGSISWWPLYEGLTKHMLPSLYEQTRKKKSRSRNQASPVSLWALYRVPFAVRAMGAPVDARVARLGPGGDTTPSIMRLRASSLFGVGGTEDVVEAPAAAAALSSPPLLCSISDIPLAVFTTDTLSGCTQPGVYRG